jgi:alpha-tubulin suppressor-like RCC1 family protein
MPNLFHYVAKGKLPPPKVIEISARGNYTMAITNKNVTWGWGNNSNGQLGDNSIIQRNTPVSVAGAVKTFCQISAGIVNTMAIDKNGRVWTWGNNQFGQLGDNSTTPRRTPVSVLGAVKTFCKISTVSFLTMAIDKNGRAWGWGYNIYGQLGNNSTTSQRTPVSVLGAVKTFCQISAGGVSGVGYVIAIDKNGRAWAWGYNANGQLGDNSVTSRLTPVSVLGAVKTFCQISAGEGFQSHTMAIDKNGSAWGWGFNSTGQLGDNSITSRLTPVSVAGAVKTFCQISAGGTHTMAIDKNGRAWGWGNNGQGRLGDNSITSRRTPVSVAGAVKTFCKISAGTNHTIAIDKDGRAWAWGSDSNGQLGLGIITITPFSVQGAVKTFCHITAGFENTLAIDKNGRAWGWGSDTNGKLGINSTANIPQTTPVSVAGAVKTFCHISAGYIYTMAIDKNGRAWGWGSNPDGNIGNNTALTTHYTPISVLGAVKTFCKISAGFDNYTMAIDQYGQAWGWGRQNQGQIGNNSLGQFRTPVSVVGAPKTFCHICAGGTPGSSQGHTTAIDKNGRAWGWGINISGQLGDNSTTSQRTPVSVLGAVKTFCQISSRCDYTMAIDKDGRAWAWGINGQGRLGDNSITSRRTPVSVAGAVKTFCQISAGGDLSGSHTMAIDKNGRAWGWGLNDRGQLGNNSFISQRTPVSVLGAVKTFCKISAGSGHTMAIDKDGRAWGWGSDNNNEIGIGFRAITPILITYL